jgi:hypothetical protein
MPGEGSMPAISVSHQSALVHSEREYFGNCSSICLLALSILGLLSEVTNILLLSWLTYSMISHFDQNQHKNLDLSSSYDNHDNST